MKMIEEIKENLSLEIRLDSGNQNISRQSLTTRILVAEVLIRERPGLSS